MSDPDYSSESKKTGSREYLEGNDTIVLEDTASTNFAARKIVLNRNGEVGIISGAGFTGHSDAETTSLNHYKIDVDIASRIFSEVEKLWPLQPGKHSGFKSISFGHCSYLTYKGERSPDLESCVATPGVKAIVSDLNVLRQLEPGQQR
jgi:hypothetical protein